MLVESNSPFYVPIILNFLNVVHAGRECSARLAWGAPIMPILMPHFNISFAADAIAHELHQIRTIVRRPCFMNNADSHLYLLTVRMKFVCTNH